MCVSMRHFEYICIYSLAQEHYNINIKENAGSSSAVFTGSLPVKTADELPFNGLIHRHTHTTIQTFPAHHLLSPAGIGLSTG